MVKHIRAHSKINWSMVLDVSDIICQQWGLCFTQNKEEGLNIWVVGEKHFKFWYEFYGSYCFFLSFSFCAYLYPLHLFNKLFRELIVLEVLRLGWCSICFCCQGVSRALVENSRTLRLPAHLHERLSSIRIAKIRLEEKGITPSIDVSQLDCYLLLQSFLKYYISLSRLS